MNLPHLHTENLTTQQEFFTTQQHFPQHNTPHKNLTTQHKFIATQYKTFTTQQEFSTTQQFSHRSQHNGSWIQQLPLCCDLWGNCCVVKNSCCVVRFSVWRCGRFMPPYRYDLDYCWPLIGSRTRPFDWYLFWWSWTNWNGYANPLQADRVGRSTLGVAHTCSLSKK